jgi:hypothetical protein
MLARAARRLQQDYNRGRPHASLGPGIPDPLSEHNQLVSTGIASPNTLR